MYITIYPDNAMPVLQKKIVDCQHVNINSLLHRFISRKIQAAERGRGGGEANAYNSIPIADRRIRTQTDGAILLAE
jgi:hypothetical protein